MVAYWPDGEKVHDIKILVKLSCGHERVSRGWRGEEGQQLSCDACWDDYHKGEGDFPIGLVTIEFMEPTTLDVCGWTKRR